VLTAILLGACTAEEQTWPPAPQNAQERLMIEAAQRAVDRYDGWPRVLFVVERQPERWRVQAWKVVNPQAKGRGQCVPWGVRSVILNEQGEMIEYQNHL
jgi:hypothetical protein